ncbi:MAG: DUF934 domain-containing protein, partial [Polaromonas sp.]
MTTSKTMKLIATQATNAPTSDLNDPKIIVFANDLDPRDLDLTGVERIELNFPKFSDGRAFSPA